MSTFEPLIGKSTWHGAMACSCRPEKGIFLLSEQYFPYDPIVAMIFSWTHNKYACPYVQMQYVGYCLVKYYHMDLTTKTSLFRMGSGALKLIVCISISLKYIINK